LTAELVIETCASSHYWSRELQALGHTVRLMLPAYVKPYVKRQKNDSTDAETIYEAVTRPNMRFVPTKAIEQQSCLMLVGVCLGQSGRSASTSAPARRGQTIGTQAPAPGRPQRGYGGGKRNRLLARS